MTQHNKPTNTSRVLRFTVTSALVMAPLTGCGPSHTSNPGPIEVVEPNTNPGPEPEPQPEPVAAEVDAGEEIDAGTDAGETPPVRARPLNAPNPGPDERLDAIRRQINANPGPHGPPAES